MPARNGSIELHALAARLKAESAGGLRLQMLRGLKEAAAPLVGDVHDAALTQLPHRGGLNEQVAGQKVTVSVRTGARTAGVRLVTRAPDTAQTDAGYVRHPTFGRRGKGDWKTEKIPNAAGWWSNTLQRKSGVRVTARLHRVMLDVGAQLQHGGRVL
jgi:hypothetical protein